MIVSLALVIMDETPRSVGQVCMLAGRAGKAVELWGPVGHGFVRRARLGLQFSGRFFRGYRDPDCDHGAMAQLVARFHGMEEVRGSNPLSSTEEKPRHGGVSSFLDAAPVSAALSPEAKTLTWFGKEPLRL